MNNARSLWPTDALALVALDTQAMRNEAHCWERLGRPSEGQRPIAAALGHWASIVTGRHTWISGTPRRAAGIISVQPRGSRLAWEVDCLILLTDDGPSVFMSLADQMTRAAARAEVLRIFLRLETRSAALPAARLSGFLPHVNEQLYQLDGPLERVPLPHNLTLRPRTRADGFALFRLYNNTVPLRVRRLEAPTYAEWIAAEEQRGTGRGTIDVVAESDGEVVAWLRAIPTGGSGRLHLLLHPAASGYRAALLSTALDALRGRRPVHCLVADYDGGQATWLERSGFAPVADYVSLVKRLAVPVKAPAPQPLLAQRGLVAG